MQSTKNVELKQEQSPENSPTGMSTLIDIGSKNGRNFILLSGGEAIAFINVDEQYHYGHSPGNHKLDSLTIHIWHLPTNTVSELNHRKYEYDNSEIRGFVISNDGRYLIAANYPVSSYIDGCNELLIWDLQNPKKLHHRISTDVTNLYSYYSSIVTEDGMLMVHYTFHYKSIFLTYSINPNGRLQLQDQFSLDEYAETVLSTKGFIISLLNDKSNTLIVRNSKGTVLHKHYFKIENGALEIIAAPINEGKSGKYLCDIELIDKTTLAFRHCDQQSIYIVDISKVDRPKQIGYIDPALLNLSKYQYTRPVPMSIKTGLVGIKQDNTLFFVHLKDNKLLGEYSLRDEKNGGSALPLYPSILQDRYLISSLVEKINNRYVRHTSICSLDLFESLEACRLAKEILYTDLYLPHELAAIAGNYLVGSNRFFTSQPTNNAEKKTDNPSPTNGC